MDYFKYINSKLLANCMRTSCALLALSIPVVCADDMLMVSGEPGEAGYEAVFDESSANWKKLFSNNKRFKFHNISHNDKGSQHDRIKEYLSKTKKDSKSPLWIVFHGHGTFDKRVANFNLRGPDVSATEMKEWLKPFTRPLVFINSSASSSPFLSKLAGPRRAIITSTQTSGEENYSYFGQYMAQALTASTADIDGDESLSLLEVFLYSSRSVDAHYDTENRITTEHALLDDNGDGKGTPADFFSGIYAVKAPQSADEVDGHWAHQLMLTVSDIEAQLTIEQREHRAELEKELALLRKQKPKLTTGAYYTKLEKIALELATLYSTKPSHKKDSHVN